MNKLVSIVIPYYNAHEYIDDLFFSIQKQTYRANCETIVVNNGSTEESTKILLEKIELYKSKINIKYLHADVAGVSNARNLGFSNSQGEYVTFIDADDIFAGKYSIEYRVDYLNENPNIDIVAGYAIWMDKIRAVKSNRSIEETENLYKECVAHPEKLPEIYMNYYKAKQRIFFFTTGSSLIRSSTLKQKELLFKPEYDRDEDVEYTLSMFEKGFKFTLLKLPFYIKRLHDNHLSSTITDELEQRVLLRIEEIEKKLNYK